MVAESHGDGAIDEGRGGDEFYGEAIGEGERVETDFDFGGVRYGETEKRKRKEPHGGMRMEGREWGKRKYVGESNRRQMGARWGAVGTG
jgi:hypothetical protein